MLKVCVEIFSPGAGLMRNALKAMNKKNEMVIMKEEKTEKR